MAADVLFGAEPAAVAAGALDACGFFAGAGTAAVPVPLSCEGFGATAVPFALPADGGTSTICGSSSMPDWVCELVWPGAVFGGAGCAACGTGWPGVLPCSGRFGSYCCAWLAPVSDAAGGATFDTNGVGARVIYSATTTAIARPTIRPSTMPRKVPPVCFDCFVVRRGFAIVRITCEKNPGTAVDYNDGRCMLRRRTYILTGAETPIVARPLANT